jgi:hypothetical protein
MTENKLAAVKSVLSEAWARKTEPCESWELRSGCGAPPDGGSGGGVEEEVFACNCDGLLTLWGGGCEGAAGLDRAGGMDEDIRLKPPTHHHIAPAQLLANSSVPTAATLYPLTPL